jgi:hypothetical protein
MKQQLGGNDREQPAETMTYVMGGEDSTSGFFLCLYTRPILPL